MKFSLSTCAAIALFILLGLAMPRGVLGQEVTVPEPGPEHKILARDIGKWDTTVKMMIPGMPEPFVSKGTEESVAVCGGLFVQTKFSGEFGGMVFEGRAIMGYDTFKKKYTGTWVDNFGTSLYHMEGTYDEDSDTLTVIMTGPDPATGDQLTQKHVTTYVDENNKKFEIYMADPTGQSDEMVMVMSMESVRKKD